MQVVLMRDSALSQFQSSRINLAGAPTSGGGVTTGRGVAGGAGVRGVGGISVGGQDAQSPTATAMSMPPALFLSASNKKVDVDYQATMHKLYKELFEKLCAAIVDAHVQWKNQARFAGITIQGPIASGGRVEGPNMEGLVKASSAVSGWVDWNAGVRDACAAGFANCWLEMQRSIKVPGLRWYPSFAAVPGRFAAPKANVPTLMSALTVNRDAMSGQQLKSEISSKLRGRNMDYSDQFAGALGKGIATAFDAWLSTQTIANVMGSGNVPTFAPPYVPVGPVVMGDNIAAPGHAMA